MNIDIWQRTFYKQHFQMMETGTLMFQARDSQLVVAERPLWQDSRQGNTICTGLKPCLKNTDTAKLNSNGIWNKPPCQSDNLEKLIESKKTKSGWSRGENADKVLEHRLLSQMLLDTMESKVYLLCIKMDFATHSTDFCLAKISVHDSFRFGTIINPINKNLDEDLMSRCIFYRIHQ